MGMQPLEAAPPTPPLIAWCPGSAEGASPGPSSQRPPPPPALPSTHLHPPLSLPTLPPSPSLAPLPLLPLSCLHPSPPLPFSLSPSLSAPGLEVTVVSPGSAVQNVQEPEMPYCCVFPGRWLRGAGLDEQSQGDQSCNCCRRPTDCCGFQHFTPGWCASPTCVLRNTDQIVDRTVMVLGQHYFCTKLSPVPMPCKKPPPVFLGFLQLCPHSPLLFLWPPRCFLPLHTRIPSHAPSLETGLQGHLFRAVLLDWHAQAFRGSDDGFPALEGLRQAQPLVPLAYLLGCTYQDFLHVFVLSFHFLHGWCIESVVNATCTAPDFSSSLTCSLPCGTVPPSWETRAGFGVGPWPPPSWHWSPVL